MDDFSIDCLTCEDYELILKIVGGKKTFDLDFLELDRTGCTLFDTGIGEIWLTLIKGNVWMIKAEVNGHFAKHYTYDFDSFGLVSCMLGAIKEVKNELSQAFTNQQ